MSGRLSEVLPFKEVLLNGTCFVVGIVMALSGKKEKAEAKLSGVVSMKNITRFGEIDEEFWMDKLVRLGVFTCDALLENFLGFGMFNKDFMDEEFLDLSGFEEDAII